MSPDISLAEILQSDAIYSPTQGGSTRPPGPPFPDAPGQWSPDISPDMIVASLGYELEKYLLP